MSSVRKKIAQIVKEEYGNYLGRMVAPLGILHKRMRKVLGDEKFLEFLEKQKKENPRPVYQMQEFKESL